jgi:uncharacterized protein (TIGR03118 family)
MEKPIMKWFKRPARPRRLSAPAFRPTLEALEDRRLPAGNVLQTNLVSDLPGVALKLDPHLVNPWGIAESSGSPFWVSDNGTGLSTLYNTAGTPQALVVSIPAPGDPLGASGTPTGTVFNTFGGANGGFKVSGFNNPTTGDPVPTSAASVFLFATEDGTIVGWNPGVNPQGFGKTKAGTYGIIAVDNSGSGAVYKGLAIAVGANGFPLIADDPNSKALLYAANFSAGTIDVFDPGFSAANAAAGAFTDPNLPKHYAPFNVQVLGGKLYVTYAKQDDTRHDEVDGHGFGFVDVYNLDGSGEQRLVSRGDLNAPWGLAVAPTASPTSDFGALAGALLVGNFGDGHIHAYNATTGAPMGELTDPDGEPIQIPGLWALQVGNGGNGGDKGTIYFTAGLDHENHGLFGSLAGVAPGAEGGAEARTEEQMVQAEIDVVQLDVITVINDITSHAPRATLRQDIQALRTAIRDLKRAEINFFIDNHTFFQGSADQGGATLQTLDTFFDQLEELRDHGGWHALRHWEGRG